MKDIRISWQPEGFIPSEPRHLRMTIHMLIKNHEDFVSRVLESSGEIKQEDQNVFFEVMTAIRSDQSISKTQTGSVLEILEQKRNSFAKLYERIPQTSSLANERKYGKASAEEVLSSISQSVRLHRVKTLSWELYDGADVGSFSDEIAGFVQDADGTLYWETPYLTERYWDKIDDSTLVITLSKREDQRFTFKRIGPEGGDSWDQVYEHNGAFICPNSWTIVQWIIWVTRNYAGVGISPIILNVETKDKTTNGICIPELDFFKHTPAPHAVTLERVSHDEKEGVLLELPAGEKLFIAFEDKSVTNLE